MDVTATAPLTHAEGMALFAAELQRNLDLMRSLDDAAWSSQTECPDWDVRRMYLHVLGAVESGASTRELVHQMRTARRYQKARGGPLEAALSATQVAERIDLSPAQLDLAVRGHRAGDRAQADEDALAHAPRHDEGRRARRREVVPGLPHRHDLPARRLDAPGRRDACDGGSARPDPRPRRPHRRRRGGRVGTPPRAAVHAAPRGPAGGVFTGGRPSTADPVIEVDAVEFCRILAGRSEGTGLLTTIVPF